MEAINNPSQIKQFSVKKEKNPLEEEAVEGKNKRKLVGGAGGSPIKKTRTTENVCVRLHKQRNLILIPHLTPPPQKKIYS